MNFELSDKLTKLIQENKLEKAIELSEIELEKIAKTEFHLILNKNLLHQKIELANYIEKFHNDATNYFLRDGKLEKETKISFFKRLFVRSNVKTEIKLKPKKVLKAIYCEMNGFTINYDMWFIDLFAFSHYTKMDLDNLDWLSEFEYSSENIFKIRGFENIQTAFENYMENELWKNEETKKAMEVCELIVILRLQELFKEAFNENPKWNNIPLLVTAHDYDMIYEIGIM